MAASASAASLALGGLPVPALAREALAAGEGKEYVFLSIVTQVPFWVDHRKALEDVQSILQRARPSFTGPLDFDTAAQARQLDELMARKPAGLLIFPGRRRRTARRASTARPRRASPSP